MAKIKMNSTGRELMAALEKYVAETWHLKAEDYGKPPRKWSGWPLLYSGYGGGMRDTCVREDGIFGDVTNLEGSITDMFRAYFRTIGEYILAEIHPSQGYISITIEPSYEDATSVVVTFGDTILLKTHCKAWAFCWETPDEMAEAMLVEYEVIKGKLQIALSSGSAQKAYVVISVYKGIIQGDDGVHVTFSKDKADELQAAADKEMGIVRDADGRYDSDNDVYCLETEVKK